MTDHDLLIRLDESIHNLKNSFEGHIEQYTNCLKILRDRLIILERGYWITIGVIFVLEIFLRYKLN